MLKLSIVSKSLKHDILHKGVLLHFKSAALFFNFLSSLDSKKNNFFPLELHVLNKPYNIHNFNLLASFSNVELLHIVYNCMLTKSNIY